MKVKIIMILILLIAITTLIFTLQSEDVDYEQVKIEELDIDFQNAINQINEKNIYFITQGETVILYTNLSKSGLYTYPYAEIKQKRDRLIVNINSHMATNDQFVKEILIARINIKHLPGEIETTFLDEKTNYTIINLG